MSATSGRGIVALLRSSSPSAHRFPRSRALRPLRARFSSTQTPNDPKPQGSLNHKTFYKTFGRPIAKVFLMAIFTYQLAYFFWVRLEQDEIKAEMQATISDLEARIEKLEQTRTQKKP
ncbi:hypothetical protein F4802DRAFT_550922 [Xylaria palmicola]|nr:hypothetical protein F4802DRAFT_550922 [Xylaria palmicola]